MEEKLHTTPKKLFTTSNLTGIQAHTNTFHLFPKFLKTKCIPQASPREYTDRVSGLGFRV
jgi:hypothetical protein